MTDLMFLDTGRCSNLLNSTGLFLNRQAGGPSCLLMLS
jgi:hypothetical protein